MKIIALVMSFLITLSSCSIPTKAYDPFDIIRDTVRIVDKNIQNAVDTVEHATDMVWNNVNATIDYLTVPRKTYYPNDPSNMSPTISNNIVSNNNDYTVNYYTCDSNNSTMVENNSYSYNSYYDFYNNTTYTTTNTTFISNTTNNYEYNTYQYEFNDNRVFITETYNTVIYTYINPETKTVDCFMLSFEMPSGDSSFNYSSGYCYGLYWVYDFVNYDYELDDNSILAYWRFDGDLHNEVPNSNIKFNYSAIEYGPGKFGDALRCNGEYPFFLSGCPNSVYTVETWYYNGDVNYKGPMSLGWHYLAWEFNGNTKTTYLDGVRQYNTSTFSQYDLRPSATLYDGVFQGSSYDPNNSKTYYKYSYLPSQTSNSIYHIDCYHPFIESEPDKLFSVSTLNSYLDSYVMYSESDDTFGIINPPLLVNGYDKDGRYDDAYTTVSPFGFPPIRMGTFLMFPYTGTSDADYSGYITQTYDNGPFPIVRIPYRGRSINCISVGWSSEPFSSFFQPWTMVSSNKSFLNMGDINSPMGYRRYYDSSELSSEAIANWTHYDLSNCYFDDMVVYSGLKYSGTSKLPKPRNSRLELEVGYTAPSGNIEINTIGIQSTVSVNQFRIGGVIPTVTHQGDVYFRLKDGYCVDCLQYIDGSWQNINFGVYDGSKWINGYTFNFYNLSFDAVDADPGTNSGIVYNYYYSGDNIYNDYFDNSASDAEKDSVFSFMRNIITLLGTLFAFIGGALPIFAFMPSWSIGLLFTFLPVCSILIVISITKHFLGGKK